MSVVVRMVVSVLVRMVVSVLVRVVVRVVGPWAVGAIVRVAEVRVVEKRLVW